MITRGNNFKQIELNIAGSSTFGRYPKISVEKSWNFFVSDNFIVPYAGYQSVQSLNLGVEGRGIHTSTKLNRLIVVVDNKVYLVNIFFDQNLQMTFDTQAILIGTLQSSSGVVYITENNKPQILISDNIALYVYDPTLSPSFQTPTINFTPGFVDFHDTRFLCAASQDNTYSPASNSTWRLSDFNNGMSWPSDAAHVGLIQTKPDNTQAIVRAPSRGNMIWVLGQTVAEPWYDVGYQLFPYQRSSSYTVDYGCINPATVSATDEIVVWLAANEKSGPIIMYTTGGEPQKITTDGIDYLFSQLTNPSDSQGFIYRQDGHLFYHINFYTDNLSLFYDFNTGKFYNASDQNLNYFIASEIAFFNNQYYFVTRNNGNLYAFDTIFTTYDGAEIPRSRTCRNIRLPSQEYFIVNDIGFTIETGETPFQQEDGGQINLITQDGKFLITQGNAIFFQTQDGQFLVTQDGQNLVSQQTDSTDFAFLVAQQHNIINIQPRVDLSVSIDGGASFSSDFPYVLNPLAQRRNRLMWWQGGLANDYVPQFKFWGLGRFVACDGVVNIRQ